MSMVSSKVTTLSPCFFSDEACLCGREDVSGPGAVAALLDCQPLSAPRCAVPSEFGSEANFVAELEQD